MKIQNYFSFNFISTLLSEIKQMEKFSVKIKRVKLIQKCFNKIYVLTKSNILKNFRVTIKCHVSLIMPL